MATASRELSRGDLRPIPDPTALTTAAILREMASLRELLETKIEGQRDRFDARIDGMDKAIVLLQKITDRQPEEVDKKITNLQVLHEEKFNSVELQFSERDVREERSARDSKLMVDTAFAAAKEAVAEQNKSSAQAIAKSEMSMGKQIEASDEKINDLKDRLTRLEGADKGRADVWGWVAAAVAILVSVAIAVLK